MPTLVLVGDSDQRVPDLADRLQGLPEAANREAAVLTGTGHRFQGRLDTAIDRAVDFLAEHPIAASED
ncbi:MAG: hypothetical protein ABEJ96_10995 [Thiohalorhabdaceae bacterium]